MTLKEIAKEAGVSVSTVSRVINQENTKAASPKVQARIWEIIRRTGYSPNKTARNLKLGQSAELRDPDPKSIACVYARTHTDMSDPFFSQIVKALELEEGSLLWHTRNCFMLAFYCAGMRAGDLIQLRGTNVVYENGGWRISYRMDKTATAKEILLLPEALEIITEYIDLQNRTSKYIFPLLDNNAPYAKAVTWESKEQLPYEIKKMLLQHTNSKNSLLNKYLGKLAAMAGIEKKVSMHIARHSFANIARQKKANVYDISKALGHSSLKITESYLSKFDTTSQDATMKQVFQNNTRIDENSLLKQLQSLNPEALASLLAKVNR